MKKRIVAVILVLAIFMSVGSGYRTGTYAVDIGEDIGGEESSESKDDRDLRDGGADKKEEEEKVESEGETVKEEEKDGDKLAQPGEEGLEDRVLEELVDLEEEEADLVEIYVDQAADGDGSEESPYKTLDQAIAAIEVSGEERVYKIFIAQGDYELSDVDVDVKGLYIEGAREGEENITDIKGNFKLCANDRSQVSIKNLNISGGKFEIKNSQTTKLEDVNLSEQTYVYIGPDNLETDLGSKIVLVNTEIDGHINGVDINMLAHKVFINSNLKKEQNIFNNVSELKISGEVEIEENELENFTKESLLSLNKLELLLKDDSMVSIDGYYKTEIDGSNFKNTGNISIDGFYRDNEFDYTSMLSIENSEFINEEEEENEDFSIDVVEVDQIIIEETRIYGLGGEFSFYGSDKDNSYLNILNSTITANRYGESSLYVTDFKEFNMDQSKLIDFSSPNIGSGKIGIEGSEFLNTPGLTMEGSIKISATNFKTELDFIEKQDGFDGNMDFEGASIEIFNSRLENVLTELDVQDGGKIELDHLLMKFEDIGPDEYVDSLLIIGVDEEESLVKLSNIEISSEVASENLIEFYGMEEVSLVNGYIHDSQAENIFLLDDDIKLKLINNTIVDNRNEKIFDIYVYESPWYEDSKNIQVMNSIIWGNDENAEGDEKVSYKNSLIEGLEIEEGKKDKDENMADDPKLEDKHRLSKDSPAINAGANSFIEGVAKDLDGNARIIDGSVDMGAFEFVTVSYEVRYIDEETGKDLSESKTGRGLDGETIREKAKTIEGYSLVGAEEQSHRLVYGEDNILAFKYRRMEEPEKPGEPEEPSRPGPPTRPEKPEGPEIPEKPGEVEEPGTPELDKERHFRYMEGYEDGSIRPEDKISREEVAAIFFRLLDKDYRETIRRASHEFPDFSKDRWSAKHIGTLAQGGILEGYEDGNFRVDARITRGEVAKIAAKFDDLSQGGKSFTDTKGHWAEDYISSASEKGWIEGYEDGSFKPDDYISRSELVTFINNVLERRVDQANILEGIVDFKDLDQGKWYYEAMVEAANGHEYEEDRLEDGSEIWTSLRDFDVEM